MPKERHIVPLDTAFRKYIFFGRAKLRRPIKISYLPVFQGAGSPMDCCSHAVSARIFPDERRCSG